MPSLTATEHIAPGQSCETDDEVLCCESSKLEVTGNTERPAHNNESVAGTDDPDSQVKVDDKADGDKGLGDCGAPITLSQLPPRDSETCTPQAQDNDDPAMKANSESIIETNDTVLNCVCEDTKKPTEINNELSSCKDPEKSEDEDNDRLADMEVADHDDLDGGWAFMVVLGSFMIVTVASVVGPGFGILFSGFLTEMKTSSTVTTAIFNSESFAWSVSNLLAGPLTEQFGWRPVATVGSLLCFTGMAASAFAPSASFLFFSHSVLTGFGSGSACLVAFAVMPHYFKRRLGRANGFTTAGMCVGGMVGPPLITYLQEQYGFKGATLIVAAFALHICVAAALFRPVQGATTVKEKSTTRPGACHLIYQMVCSLARNCLLLKSPRAMVIALGGSFVVGIYLNSFLLVPFLMEEKGHTQDTAAWCLSIANFGNLAGRVIISSCADLPWFNILACYITLATVMSCCTIAYGLVNNVTWIMAILSLWGFSVGSCMSLYSLIMMRYMGIHLFVAVFGVSGFMNGIWMLCCGPLIGVVRDLSGSYVFSVCVLGASGFFAVILFLLMPAAVAYDKRKENQQAKKARS